MKKIDEINQADSCLGKAYDDEPVFVLRAKDPIGAKTVRMWAALAYPEHEEAKRLEAQKLAAAMDEWRAQYKLGLAGERGNVIANGKAQLAYAALETLGYKWDDQAKGWVAHEYWPHVQVGVPFRMEPDVPGELAAAGGPGVKAALDALGAAMADLGPVGGDTVETVPPGVDEKLGAELAKPDNCPLEIEADVKADEDERAIAAALELAVQQIDAARAAGKPVVVLRVDILPRLHDAFSVRLRALLDRRGDQSVVGKPIEAHSEDQARAITETVLSIGEAIRGAGERAAVAALAAVEAQDLTAAEIRFVGYRLLGLLGPAQGFSVWADWVGDTFDGRAKLAAFQELERRLTTIEDLRRTCRDLAERVAARKTGELKTRERAVREALARINVDRLMHVDRVNVATAVWHEIGDAGFDAWFEWLPAGVSKERALLRWRGAGAQEMRRMVGNALPTLEQWVRTCGM